MNDVAKMSTQKLVGALRRDTCAILIHVLIQWLHLTLSLPFPVSCKSGSASCTPCLSPAFFSPIPSLVLPGTGALTGVPCTRGLPVQISPWSCPVAHHGLSVQLFSLLPLIGCLSTLSALEEGVRSHSRHPWDDLSPCEVSSWSEGRFLEI